jgi:hypothetical protein
MMVLSVLFSDQNTYETAQVVLVRGEFHGIED